MMPPRKVNRSPVKAAEKKPRGRQKTVKPVLKTPSVVKVKLKLPTVTTVDENVENEVLLFEDVEVKNPVTKNYTITKKKEVKQAITKDAPVKKKGQAKGAAKNDTTVGTSGVQEHNPACDISQIDAILKTNDDVKGVKTLVTNNNTIVKRKYVKKANTKDAPVQKKDQTGGAAKNDTSIEPNIKEVKKPVTKNNTTVKRKNVKKATTKDAPVKKKAQAKVAAKNDVETSVIRENIPICDKSQITPNYYKVLLANDVVKWQFPNNSKYENEQRNEKFWQVVEDKKQSTSKQSKPKKPPTKERANKHNVTSKDKSDYDSTKRKQPPKNVTKTYSPEKSDCKAILTSKDESMDDADNKTMINTKNTEQSIKRKHKLSLNRKTAKAGPLKKVVDSVKKEKVVCKKGKPVKSTTKNQGIIIGKSIENCNFDECADKMEQASISSVKSWTKDISSSSNSSFITVDSNNWHYFGNKIPVVQLNDIAENLIGNRNVVVADSVIRGNQKTTNATDQQYCGSLTLNNRWFSSFSSSNSNQKEFNFCSEQNRNNNYCSTEIEENVADVTRSSLRLSTSSTSSSDSSSSSSSSDGASVSETSQKNLGQTSKIHESKLSEGEMSVNSKYKMILQNLNSKIKLTQLSFKNKSNRTITKHEQERISRINDTLKQETIVHKMCQSIAQIEIDDVDKYLIRGECLQTTNIPCPKTQETHYSKDNQIINEHDNRSEECIKQHDNLQQYCPAQEADAVAADEIAEKNDSNYHLSHNKSNLNALGDNDDDDALSLFAESLTGLEPCRRNSTFNSEMSNFEEYVPQPVIHTEQQRQKIIYQPTKISNNIEAEILQCKKHEADSTSVLIDFNKPNTQENNIYEDKVGNRSQNLPTSQDIVTKNTPAASKPRLMALYHGPVPWTRSVVLKGYCFFNTMSKCKKLHCKYPHEHPNVKDVKNTLQRISENSFIQEYMLMRNSPQLRRKYGLCFVEECIRRELTRILVEIAIDFIIRTSQQSTEDNVLKSEVVDTVLMYLNQVDLSTCDDLLNFNLQNDNADLLLCDYFMSVIAMSQNFSRFKSIFIKLTDLMYRNERKFSVDVAESILERFCILPYDDLLARALLIILKNTDVTIFSNAKIGDLEKQLKASNGDLYHELESIKEQALGSQPVLDNHHERTCKPPQSLEVDKMNTNNVGHMDKNIIRYSPDTTDLGHANKPPIKIQRNITTTFNRTVNIDKLQNLGDRKTIQNKFGTQVVNNTSFKWANPSTLKIGEKAKTNLNNTTEDGRKMWQWNNRSIFDTYSNRNRNNPPMWPQKAPFKRHSNWNFDGSPKKMKRYSGPSQYQSDMS